MPLHRFFVLRLRIVMLGLNLAIVAAVNVEARQTADEVQQAAPLSVVPQVDPRVELFCVVFRLAGHPEYNRAAIKPYAQDVDQHFGPFRDHPVIKMARDLRASRGISFDACMSLAAHLEDANTLQPRLPLDPLPKSLDARWTPETARQFVEQLQLFAKESGFADFFDRHRPLYEQAESRMKELLDREVRLDWFPAFFGARPAARFHLVLAPLNGPNNYGVQVRSPGGHEQLYAILGIWSVDQEAQPTFDAGVVRTLVHEFTHSYTNPLVDRHEAQLRPAGEKLFAQVAPAMKRQAYGAWTIMLRETLVRACTLRYVSRHQGPLAVIAQTAEELSRQFFCVAPLASLLQEEYENDREKYPTFDSFMPRIIAFFDEQAVQLAEKPPAPQVLEITPADGDIKVDPALAVIRVVFDRPMKDQSWSLVGGPPTLPAVTGKPSYDKARTTWTVPIRLKPETSYQFQLNSSRFQAFQSEQGTPLAPVIVRFRTAAAGP